jgi:hypothetical protein
MLGDEKLKSSFSISPFVIVSKFQNYTTVFHRQCVRKNEIENLFLKLIKAN